jgi:membrane protein required for colicin V production
MTEPEFLLTWADLAIVFALLVSVVVGAVRGFVFEALSLGAWVLAYLAAPFLAPVVGSWLPPQSVPGGWQEVAAVVLAFVLVLVLCGLAARLLRALLHATPLKAADRLLGSGFGLLRGVLLVLLAAVLIGFTPLRQHPAWTESHARPAAATALQALAPLLPQDLHRLLERHAPQAAPDIDIEGT